MLRKPLSLTLGVLAAMGGGVAQAADCPVLDSRNWSAWIDAVPGVDAKRVLHVTGEVDLPTPGFTARWTLGPADRRLIPSQFILLDFAPPAGINIQMIDAQTVAFETAALYPQYDSIKIRCGETLIAEITEIEEVH